MLSDFLSRVFFSLELAKTENNPPSEMDKLIFIAKKLAPEQILLLAKGRCPVCAAGDLSGNNSLVNSEVAPEKK